MSEQGFHEIQLNGKQLVFLFMAATVVSVLIFLCGVMVGRGVRPAVAAAGDSAAPITADAPEVDAAAGSTAAGADVPGSGEVAPPSSGAAPELAPPPVQDDENYDFDARLTDQKANDRLGPTAPPAEAAPKPSEPPTRAARAEAPPARAEAPAATSAAPAAEVGRPQPGTFVVQLAAVRERADADALAKTLVGKGYSAYVVMPSAGGPPVYRVQVGRYKTRGEAERAAARLRKEGRYKPWVTR